MKILQGLCTLGHPFARRLIRNFGDTGGDPHKQRGVTMIEAMLGLTVIAVVTAAGIVMFQTVSVRTEAQRYTNGLTPLVVDLAEYLDSHHNANIFGLENVLQVTQKAANISTWNSATFPGLTAGQCTLPANTCGNGSQACNATRCGPSGGIWYASGAANPLMLRIANLPSIQFKDDIYDDDTNPEWMVAIGNREAVELRWIIEPDDGDALGNGNIDPCPITNNLAKPDTAIAFQILFPNKDVCDATAKSLGRFDHISSAFCHDSDTKSTWKAGFTGNDPDGNAAMFLCFNEQR